MAKRYEFDEFEGRTKAKAGQCVACEEMLADALDESLSEEDRTWFDRHVSTCGDCSEMLADAQRGAAWLEMLKTPRPEPSARLVERILAQTGGQPGELRSETLHLPQMVPGVAPSAVSLAVPGNLLEFRPRMAKVANWSNVGWRRGVRFEPRLAMTAAMAFFSIALTLNLTGVQLNRLHASDLSPSGLKRTYYTANADAVRYYDNLRVVRVLESRVEDLRQAVADRTETPKSDLRQPEPQPQARPHAQPQPRPEAPKNEPEQKKKPGPGVSRQAVPAGKPEVLNAAAEMPGERKIIASLSKLREAGGLG